MDIDTEVAALLAALASSACEKPTSSITGPESPVLTSVSLSPVWATLHPASSLHLSAYGRYNTGDAVPLGTAVKYSASAGTITPDGLFTPGERAGGYIVFAEAGGLSDMSFVTVTAPPPAPAALARTAPQPAGKKPSVSRNNLSQN